MALINKPKQSQEISADLPQSLSVAYNVQKRAGKRTPPKPIAEEASTPSQELPQPLQADDERPSSIADAILRKRQAAKPVPEDDLDLLEDELPEPEAELAPEPQDMISKIRQSLKAKRGF